MWFKVDDGFYMHPKVLGLSARAGWLWLRAGCWSADQMTDGLIPMSTVHVLGGSKRDAEELVEAGLWEHVQDDFGFHDWEKYQFTAEEIAAQRKARAEAGRRGGQRSGESRRSKTEAKSKHLLRGCFDNGEAKPNPVPSRPDQLTTSVKTNDHRGSYLTRAKPHDDQFNSWFQERRISPDQVLARLNANGAEHTPGDVVVLFDALSRLASAPIVNGTAYLLAAIEQTPGEVEKILAGGEAA